MKEFTDTDRLNFMLSFQPDMDYDWKSGNHWLVFNTYVNDVRRKVVASADSYRNAIDNALNEVYSVVD